MSVKLLKVIAVLLMLLALGWVVGAISATTKSSEIQGPSALAVLPDQSVWISVDEALWHLDASGNRVSVVDGTTLGVGGRIGNLVVHPNGQLVAQVRNDSTLYFLDPESALIKSRLVPQWQTDLSEHGSDAINYVFHNDGRVAIATGGGHAVAVFDADGRLLGRTKPGMYEFTNGLWWVGDTLWTSDTNREQLVELDGSTLDERSRVQLSRNCGGYEFLGMAASSHGKASDDAKSAPLVTLVRFASGMTKGRASDIFSDGSQLDFPVSAGTEPRDIRWRGNTLLMVDGKSFSIKRYSDDRAPMDDFGDAEVKAELASLLDGRNSLEKQYYGYLGGAILFFLIGFAFALRAQSLERARTLASLNVDLSQLGTPILSASAQFVASVKIYWPLILAVTALAISPSFLGRLSRFGQLSPTLSLVLFFVLQLLFIYAVVLFHRNLKRYDGNPAIEALLNLRAIQFLKTETTFWQGRQPGELPQETFLLANTKAGLKWVVLTNQRLLVFVSNLRDRKLAHEYPRGDILGLRMLESHELKWAQRLQRFLNPVGAVICIEFRNGNSLVGFITSAQTARRVSSSLQSTTVDTPPVDTASPSIPAQTERGATATQDEKAIRQTIASFLIPGLGQWIQRRSGTALLYFVVWLCVLMLVLVVIWTLWKSLAAVSLRSIVIATGYYLAVCALAALDTWRMRERD